MAQSDTALTEGIARRDAKAFEVLFERYRETIRRRLVAMLRDESAADDLTQEVFLRLWTRADEWQTRGSIRAWLLRVATNLALNRLRSAHQRRRRPLQVRPAPSEDEDENPAPGWMIDVAALGPHALLERAEREQRLRGLVNELSEEKREVLDMIFEQDMQIASAAEALGIPEGTVKSRLHYAIKRLAQQYRDIEGIEEDM